MPHKKKINKMSAKECSSILLRLTNSKESQYYKEVDQQLKRLQNEPSKKS